MCGRFTLSRQDRVSLERELGVPLGQLPADSYRPRYNIAPTNGHWIMRMEYEDRELLRARWGLINHWAKDGYEETKHPVDTRPAQGHNRGGGQLGDRKSLPSDGVKMETHSRIFCPE